MSKIGRRPTVNFNLPSNMAAKKTSSGKTYYYYVTSSLPRKWTSLGSSYIDAIVQWTSIHEGVRETNLVTFPYIKTRYIKEILPTKATSSQRSNLSEFKKLDEFFGNPPAPINDIKPINISQYYEWRKLRPDAANREVALFSHLFNQARAWGYTDQANPCQGIPKFKTNGRKDVYVDDALFEKVYSKADQPLRDALDLIYLAGQRPSDVQNMKEDRIANGCISVRQGKTNRKIRIKIEGALLALFERIKERKFKCKSTCPHLLVNELGAPLTKNALRYRFDKAREAAEIDPKLFQYRDLRAKAGTDKEESDGMKAAQEQLGHQSERMTSHYVRNRLGKKVSPTR
jgi:integrase